MHKPGKKKATIVHINMHRNLASHREISEAASYHEIDIIMTQEVNTNKDGGPTSILGYRPIFTSKSGSPVKAVTYVRESSKIAITSITQFTYGNIVTCEIHLQDKNITLINAYIEPEEAGDESLATLEEILQQRRNKLIVLAGDFNGRNTLWNDRETNKRGEEIETIMMQHNLILANKGSESTFVNSRGGNSIIDLTMASIELIDQLREWKIDPTICSISDHHAISFELVSNNLTRPPLPSTRKFKTSDHCWEEFDTELASTVAKNNYSTGSLTELQESLVTLDRQLTTICEKLFITRSRSTKRVEWWTDDLNIKKRNYVAQKTKVRRLKDLVKSGRLSQSTFDKEVQLLGEKKNEFTSTIQQLSNQSFRKMVEETDERDAFSLAKKILKHKRSLHPYSTMKFNGKYTLSCQETQEKALEHFYPADTREYEPEGEDEISCLNEEVFDEPPFTEPELIEATNKLSCKKAPGHDGFTADIIKRLVNGHPRLVLDLFNGCLCHGYFPKHWKIAVCKLIPKPGKEDYDAIESWRPVGLLSIFGKLFESMIVCRLRYYLDSRRLLSDKQFGFTEQTSTIDALNDYIKLIKQAKKEDQVMLISMDIKGAFDNVKWPIIKRRLKELNVPPNLRAVFDSYLSDREVWAKTIDGWAKRSTNQGCVQGSCSGAFIWNIILDTVFNIKFMNDKKVHLRAFADDCNLVIHARDPINAVNYANDALRKLVEWGQSNGLEFQPSKTSMVIFTKKLRSLESLVTIGEKKVESKTSVKILGVIIDRGLNFRDHLLAVTKKANRTYNSIASISRKTWGASFGVMRTIYMQAIRPIVTYASPVWFHVLKTKKTREIIKKFERKYLIHVTKAYRTVSYEALYVLADCKPIHLVATELAETYLAKKSGILKIESVDSDGSPVTEIVQLEKIERSKVLGHPATRLQIGYDKIDSQSELEEKFSTTDTIFFTDASKWENHVGAAWTETINHGKEVITTRHLRLGNNCQVLQAELLAIIEVIERNAFSAGSFPILCSDSEQSLELICGRTNRLPLVIRARSVISRSLERGVTWQLFKVTGHTDIVGNKRCDKEAKRSLRMPIEPIYQIATRSLAKRFWSQVTTDWWQEEYENSTNASVTKRTINHVSQAVLLRESAELDFFLTQALTGHGANLFYLKRFKKRENDRCILCSLDESQTIEHLLERCEVFGPLRDNYQRQLASLDRRSTVQEQLSIFAGFARAVMKKAYQLNNLSSEPHQQQSLVTSDR